MPIDDAIDQVRRGDSPDLDTDEKHSPKVYVVAEEGADQQRIEREIKDMPHYLEPYDTTVEFIDQQEMNDEDDGYPHGGFVMASGKIGNTGNEVLIVYRCDWDGNPEATANILIAHARAAHRINERGENGARTRRI